MVDLEDVPTNVLDLLKIFLASSLRGERAVLVLETQNRAINTKYRSMDTVVGAPAPPTSTNTKRRKNPARVRRSQLRLEVFRKKKLEEKHQLEEASSEHQQSSDNQAAGITSNKDNRLILDLAMGEDRTLGSCPFSPILQVDGTAEKDRASYSFVSMYAEEDILYTLEEIFPTTEFRCILKSRERIEPLGADHLCILDLEALIEGKTLTWPEMGTKQVVVFEKLRRI